MPSLNPPDANDSCVNLNSTVTDAMDHSICSKLNMKVSIRVVAFAITFLRPALTFL